MKNRFFTLIVFFCFQTFFSQTIYKDYIDGEIYVKFSRASLNAVAKENPTNIPISKFGSISKILYKYGVTKAYKPFYQATDDAKLPYVVKFEFSQFSAVNSFMEEMRAIPGVEYSEKVPLMKIDATPNDFSISTASVHLNQINAQNAWNVFNGNSNIVVAIVDNAVMWTHSDLVGNTYTNTIEANGTIGVDDDGNGYIDDLNGYDVADNDNNAVPTNTLMDHGTHCAGIAGARTDNGSGIASIGWNIKILPVKCTYTSTTAINNGYGGIIYAARANARIISCSWGGSGSSATEQSVVNYAWNRGCIVIASAGNNGTTVQNYPGAYNNVYCVANVGTNNVKASSSSYGSWVDISAPGQTIYSTLPSAGSGTYGYKSGTSMACPLVAGLAGLMLSKCSYMTRTDVLNCISSTAVNIYTIVANNTYSASSQLGAGRIEAYQAMLCAASFTNALPVANFYASQLSSCPNTLIHFSDSSIYQPTTWNWTFQGGSPATSTLTNPNVQWTTPGTYSVSLTVTNANGTHTKTKLSYITITGPIAPPLVEGFQSLPFLPVNWTSKNINNDNIYWARVTGPGGFGTSNASAVFDNYSYAVNGDRDEMITPKYIFSNVSNARLRFDVSYARYDAINSDSLEVKLSTNCGTTWTSIYLKGGTTLATAPDNTGAFTPTSLQWRRDTIDISALTAGQGNVMFSFINHGQYGNRLYLDNINLAFPSPTLNVNAVPAVCAGAVINLTNTSVSAATYTWSFNGGIPAVSNAINPSVSFATPGVHSYTLSATNGTATSSITRTVNIVASPTLTANNPVICNGSAAVCTITGASSYTWNPGGLTGPIVTLSPASTSIYTVIGSNGTCASQITSTITVNQTPTISANNQTICSGGTATVIATGATSYSWNTGSTSATLLVSPALTTNYTVTGTNTFGCTNTRTISVTVGGNIVLTPVASSPSICSGSSTSITANGATSYTWSTGSNANSILVSPTTTTTYTLQGSSGSCFGSTVISISVANSPTVNLNSLPPTTICIGSTATLSALGATSYSWNNGATSSSIIVSPTITSVYTVTGTSNGCSNSQTVAVAVSNSSLNLMISQSSPTICAGGTTTLNVTGATSYTWSNGSNANSIVVSPSISTTYSVTGSNGICSASNTGSITVISLPSVSLSSSSGTSICNGSSVTLNATGATSYAWSNGSTGNSILVSPSSNTVYSVVGANPAGCTNTQTISIAVGASSITIGLTSNPPAICGASSATISAIGANSYTWNTGSTTSSIVVNPSVTTTYSVTGTNGVCFGNSIITLSVGSAPTINLLANPSTSICSGGTATLTATGATSYSWDTGGSGSSIIVSPSVTTIYTVTGSSSGCSTTQTVSVGVGASSIALVVNANPSSACAGMSATINVSGANSYTWSNGSTGNNIVVSPSVTTNYTVTGANGLCTGNAITTISITPAPPLSILVSPSNTICIGTTVLLNASGSYTNFVWTNPAVSNTSIVVTPSANVSYTVFASGSTGGCSTSSVVAITLTTAPVSVLTTSNSSCGTFCSGILNATTSGGTSPYSYSLATEACTAVPCYNLCAGLYNLITIDASGCTSSNIFSIANAPNNLLASISSTNVSCTTCTDGVLSVNPSGGAAPYTYTWFPAGGNNSTAINLGEGCYTVSVQDVSGCTINSTACIGIGVGLQTIKSDAALLIYPNPAKTFVNVEYLGTVFNYSVYNNLGQLVAFGKDSQNSTTIRLETFAKGIYLIEVEMGGNTLRKKLVVE